MPRHKVIPRTLCFVFDEDFTQTVLIKYGECKGEMAGHHNGNIDF